MIKDSIICIYNYISIIKLYIFLVSFCSDIWFQYHRYDWHPK